MMKLCKDCKYCETPDDSDSLCTHYKATIWVSTEYTDVVTGERKGENIYNRHTCEFMREGYNEDGKCGWSARLFEPLHPEPKKPNWIQKLFNKSLQLNWIKHNPPKITFPVRVGIGTPKKKNRLTSVLNCRKNKLQLNGDSQ